MTGSCDKVTEIGVANLCKYFGEMSCLKRVSLNLES